jgi:glutamate 5-kinase
LTSGNITIDAGAKQAVLNRNSLLSVGILTTEGEFESGEIIELKDEANVTFAVARTRCSSADIPIRDKIQGFVVAHANDIVVV